MIDVTTGSSSPSPTRAPTARTVPVPGRRNPTSNPDSTKRMAAATTSTAGAHHDANIAKASMIKFIRSPRLSVKLRCPQIRVIARTISGFWIQCFSGGTHFSELWLQRLIDQGGRVNVVTLAVAILYLALIPQFIDPGAGQVIARGFQLGAACADPRACGVQNRQRRQDRTLLGRY